MFEPFFLFIIPSQLKLTLLLLAILKFFFKFFGEGHLGPLLWIMKSKHMKKFQKDLDNNSPKTGYRLHSKFKWEAKSPG